MYTVVGYGVPGVLGGVGGGLVSTAWGLSAVFACGSVAGLMATACALRVWGLAHRSATAGKTG